MLDVSSMRPTSELRNPAVIDLARQAEQFLTSHHWCKSITQQFLAWALAPQVGVFFCQLVPTRTDIDHELWVIVGDLPPAYLVCDKAHTWQEALDAYGVEMMKWVEAAREGRSVAGEIPVNVSPTPEYANMLETRINLLWERFVDVPAETLPTDI